MKDVAIIVLGLMLCFTCIQLITARKELRKTKEILTLTVETCQPWLNLPLSKSEMARIR